MNVYEIITQRIMEQLEHGTVPWQQPWNHKAGLPRNLLSQKDYRGINVWILASAGYSSPYWLTYRQAQEIGGFVRRGEHGSPVVFWKFVDQTRLGRFHVLLSGRLVVAHVGIKTSATCSHENPSAKRRLATAKKEWKTSRPIARQRCPKVISPWANANFSEVEAMAGARWSSDCARQLKRRWRLTASSLRT